MNYCGLAKYALDTLDDEQLKTLCSHKPPILIITPDGDKTQLAFAETSELVTAAFKHAGAFMIGFMIEIEEQGDADMVEHWLGVLRHNGVIEQIMPGQEVN